MHINFVQSSKYYITPIQLQFDYTDLHLTRDNIAETFHFDNFRLVGGLNRKIRGVAALLATAMKLGMH